MKRLLLLFLLPIPSFATIATTTVWEIRLTNGSDTNGGAFVPGATGTDMSQFNNKNAAACTNCQSATVNISTTDVVTTGVATVTSATGNYSAALVGNIVWMTGSGVSTSWYQVVTFTNSTTIVLDRSPGTGTGGTINIGGALKTLNQIAAICVGAMGAYIKAEATVSVTSGQTWGCGPAAVTPFWQGYSSTRGDGGQVTVQATSGTNYTLVNLVSSTTNSYTFQNFIIDCNNKTGTSGLTFNNDGNIAQNILVKNCTGTQGIRFQNNQTCRYCYVTGQSGTGNPFTGGNNTQIQCIYCGAYSNTTTGAAFNFASGFFFGCFAVNNTGSGSDGFSIAGSTGLVTIASSNFSANNRDGIRITQTTNNYPITIFNSIFTSNGGYGINSTSYVPSAGGFFDYNAFYNNTTAARSNITAGAHDVTLSGEPYTNLASNILTLNNTTGAGAALKAVGFPGALFTVGTAYFDIGALQSQAGAASITIGRPVH